MSAIIGRPAVLAALLVALAALLAPAGAGAAVNTLTVNSTADPGDGSCATGGCTLREAITELDDGDTTDQDRIEIQFNSLFDHTITLGSTLPNIGEPLSLASSGVAAAVISGNDAVAPFSVVGLPGTDVRISGLVITRGRAGGSGGAIGHSGVDLTISNSAITGNRAVGATGSGGGIYSPTSGGTIRIESSTFSDNQANGRGGGIYVAVPATIVRTTVSGNQAHGPESEGGGIAAFAPLEIESSTISGNINAGNFGGGIRMGSGVIRNSTISGNWISGAGGGVYSTSANPDPSIANTIVANNIGTPGPDLESLDNTFQLEYALIEDPTSAPFAHAVPGSNLLGVDPQLGPLAGNGGPTFTHLPAATSPVVDQGSTAQATDQRTAKRPSDNYQVANSGVAGSDGADIGAVELPAPPAPPGGGSTGGGGPGPGGGATPSAKPLAFGARTLVTLKLGRKSIGRRGPVFVVVSNRNGFPVTGRVSGTSRRLKLKAKPFRAGPNARKTVKLKLSKRLRRLLVRKRKLTLRLAARVQDPAGHARSVKKTVKPKLKRKRKRRKR